MGSKINEFRRKIAFGQYELTGHAKEEMEQDGFTIADVKNAIYSGRIAELSGMGASAGSLLYQAKQPTGVQLIWFVG